MKNRLTRITPLILITAFLAAISTGCGTVRGIGSDVGDVGRGIEKATR